MPYTIKETVLELKEGKTTSVALVKKSIENFEADKHSEKPLNAFLEIYEDALLKAEAADKEIRSKGKRKIGCPVFGKTAFGNSFCEQGQ